VRVLLSGLGCGRDGGGKCIGSVQQNEGSCRPENDGDKLGVDGEKPTGCPTSSAKTHQETPWAEYAWSWGCCSALGQHPLSLTCNSWFFLLLNLALLGQEGYGGRWMGEKEERKRFSLWVHCLIRGSLTLKSSHSVQSRWGTCIIKNV